MTPLDAIHARLLSSWDSDAYGSLFREVARFNGCTETTSTGGGHIPVWAELRQDVVKMGEVQDMVYAMQNVLARLRSRDVGIEFVDLEEEVVKEARTEWWRTRCRGTAYMPGWSSVHDVFATYGIGFGSGTIEVGYQVGRDGRPFVDHQYVEPYNMLCDPYAATPEACKWMARVMYMSKEDFEKRYPNAKNPTTLQKQSSGTGDLNREMVRVIRYFDYETKCVLLNDIDGEELERSENEFGCIPFVQMTYLKMPGARFPIGLVQMMSPIQIGMNKIRTGITAAAENHGFLVMSKGVLSEESLEDMNNKAKPLDYVYESDAPMSKDSRLFEQVPHQTIDPNVQWLMAEYTRAMNPASASTDFSMGRAGVGVDTATEAEIINEQSSAQQSLIQSSYARAFEWLIRVTVKIAKEFDRAQMTLKIGDVSTVLNGDDDDLTTATLFEADSQVYIAEEGLFASDQERKKQKRRQSLQESLALAGSLGLDVMPIAKQIFALDGLDMASLAPQPQTGMVPGMQPPQQQVSA